MSRLLQTLLPRRRGLSLIKIIAITAFIYFLVDYGFRQDESEETHEKWSLDRKPVDKFQQIKPHEESSEKSDDDDVKEKIKSKDDLIIDEFFQHLSVKALKTRKPYVKNMKALEEIRPEIVRADDVENAAEEIKEDKNVVVKSNTKAVEKQGDEGVEPQAVLDEPDDNKMNIFGVDNPGELGKAVRMPAKLTPDVKKLYDEGWKKNSFNQYVSDHISIHRELPDLRTDYCKAIASNYSKTLPATSVIIIFHNEAWSTLLRSVHTVIDRTPEHLLTEVIIVDDFSDMGLKADILKKKHEL